MSVFRPMIALAALLAVTACTPPGTAQETALAQRVSGVTMTGEAHDGTPLVVTHHPDGRLTGRLGDDPGMPALNGTWWTTNEQTLCHRRMAPDTGQTCWQVTAVGDRLVLEDFAKVWRLNPRP